MLPSGPHGLSFIRTNIVHMPSDNFIHKNNEMALKTTLLNTFKKKKDMEWLP